jgi:predicted DNA-binding transcriptional regulator YafY
MDQPKIERIIRLLKLLIGNYRKTRELAEILECDLRTLQRYLQSFSKAGIVIEYREKGVPYVSTNKGQMKDISDLVHFTEEEAYILHKAIDSIDNNNMLKQNLKKKLYNIYNYPWLAEVIVKPEQGKNVEALIIAIQGKKYVKLINYRSANSNKISDRIVEPYNFTTNYEQIWCYEPFTSECKLFKVARIEKVEVMEQGWKFENLHVNNKIDVFRISNSDYIGTVVLNMNIRAYNLLIEEYPLSEKYTEQKDDNNFLLNLPVCSYEGPARFVMGLYEDIKIEGDKNFIKFINSKIKKISPSKVVTFPV